VYSDVEVDMQVHLGGQANDHCTATIFKVPDHSRAGPGAVVNSGGNPTGNTGTFTSSGLEGTTDFLNYRLEYPAGGSAVGQGTGTGQQGAGDDGATFLDKFIVDFQRGTRARPGIMTPTSESPANAPRTSPTTCVRTASRSPTIASTSSPRVTRARRPTLSGSGSTSWSVTAGHR
jgi:hypothetical protein